MLNHRRRARVERTRSPSNIFLLECPLWQHDRDWDRWGDFIIHAWRLGWSSISPWGTIIMRTELNRNVELRMRCRRNMSEVSCEDKPARNSEGRLLSLTV